MALHPQLWPFWASTITHDESLFFVGRTEAESTASLLFPPERVLSVRTATHEFDFIEGRDYRLDRGAATITRCSRSPMPCTPSDEIAALCCAQDDDFHRRQVSISYTHQPGLWHGYAPRFAGAELPGTHGRLLAGQPLRLSITGDSISEGYNASAFIQVPPRQPAYGPLVAAGLEQVYGSPIELHNFAVAGWTSDNGLADVDRVAAVNPHLVIIAYGMNDAGYAEPVDFAGNVEALIAAVRATSPLAEFVVVSPMLPSPAWDEPVMARFPAYRDALAKLCGRGVVLADLTTVWTHLLARKSSDDLTGNGVNHPNDFGHRVYAQVILALLVPPPRLTDAPGK